MLDESALTSSRSYNRVHSISYHEHVLAGLEREKQTDPTNENIDQRINKQQELLQKLREQIQQEQSS
jgi:hypothetical protein